jgi:hypothetical protein
MRKLALTGAAMALVLALTGVVAISAASQAAEPSTHKRGRPAGPEVRQARRPAGYGRGRSPARLDRAVRRSRRRRARRQRWSRPLLPKKS